MTFKKVPRLGAAMARIPVVKVTAPIVLDFGNGLRFHIAPAAAPTSDATGRRGRKPSPATQALAQALQRDAADGEQRSRDEYLAILRDAGHKGAGASAGVILNREAKRIFGKPLGARNRGSSEPGGPGRKASSATVLLRQRLQADKSNGGIRDAPHYIRWLVDKANIGLKKARPVVYRELRAAKN